MNEDNQETINNKCHINGIMSLMERCYICDCRADFKVTYSNKELPDGYIKDGQRNAYYCESHLPERIKHQWDFFSDLKNW